MSPLGFVEASSLSDITELASNPPKYPRNPTEQKREPLTLYLARVPGTRDIILSTLKPQLKNVTAHDVASSLYYLHLNSEDDLKLREEEEANITEHEDNRRPSVDTIKSLTRKPLPESARASLDIPRQVENSAGTSGLYSTQLLGKSPSLRSISRKPLAPRSPVTSPVTGSFPGSKPLPGIENEAQRPLQEGTSIPRASTETTRGSTPEPFGYNYDKPLSKFSNSFSITIIRRDPISGAQWNIGTVSGNPTTDAGRNENGTASPQKSKKPYFDMSVHLTAPGYTKFRNAPLANHLAGNHSQNHESHQGASIASSFDRKITMEGSSFWHSRQHKKNGSEGVAAHGRDYGSSSTDNDNEGETLSPERSSTKGYIFISPWGGRCKFSTGGGGRSLKCKHTLPKTTHSASDSMAAPQASAAVSELRFNLPSSDIFASFTQNLKDGANPKHPKHFSIPKFGHTRNKSSSDTSGVGASYGSQSASASSPNDAENRPPLPPRPNYSSHAADLSDDEYDDRLGISLGQEKAGGGNRGKRAKLGKLIVYDEGFKMLDLVVASNMGIWWSVWESDFR
ncbi:hypothetical protein HYALB_00001282 [Hymenoscyphus albidus]|uniref:Oxidoreductase-like protein n=1 Tax=Hymenoscyphus albidus TaxID=595503 RepID=A0A9N9LF00_9HELO|nr:hypothetical protein HYALB_00001282 [Hymenoscyphus albidus]